MRYDLSFKSWGYTAGEQEQQHEIHLEEFAIIHDRNDGISTISEFPERTGLQ